jgi:hypothetical protein
VDNVLQNFQDGGEGFKTTSDSVEILHSVAKFDGKIHSNAGSRDESNSSCIYGTDDHDMGGEIVTDDNAEEMVEYNDLMEGDNEYNDDEHIELLLTDLKEVVDVWLADYGPHECQFPK